MHILMLLESTFPPDIRVENEIGSLLTNGFSVTILCYSKSHKQDKFRYRGANIIAFPAPTLFKKKLSALALSLPFYFSVWKQQVLSLFRTNHFDVIHVHDLPLVSVGFYFKEKYGTGLVLDLHENRPEIMKLYYHTNTFLGKLLISLKKWRQYEKKFINSPDRLIFVTSEAQKLYQKQYGIEPGKSHVVPNFVHLDCIKERNYPLDKKYVNKKIVVYFGDTGKRRGTITILKAAKAMEKTEFVFVIIGSSKEQIFLEEYIREQTISNVELLGWLPLDKAISIIKQAYVGILPLVRNLHHDTTFANKMFLYMGCKIPVVVSDCPAQKNFVEKHHCGLVFEAENPDDLKEKLLLLTDESLYKNLQAKAEQTAQNQGNWKQSEANLLKLYRSLSFES